ncbi:MAG: hypothetical protein ABIP94_21660 [Planctomycetota bacterium]
MFAALFTAAAHALALPQTAPPTKRLHAFAQSFGQAGVLAQESESRARIAAGTSVAQAGAPFLAVASAVLGAPLAALATFLAFAAFVALPSFAAFGALTLRSGTLVQTLESFAGLLEAFARGLEALAQFGAGWRGFAAGRLAAFLCGEQRREDGQYEQDSFHRIPLGLAGRLQRVAVVGSHSTHCLESPC